MLPTLTKIIFSQPVDKNGDSKITVRPVMIKNELRFQIESFRDNKAFHRNVSETDMLSAVEELEGRFRQVMIASAEENRQFCLKTDGSYKKTGTTPGVRLSVAGRDHNRSKEYILSEGENIPAFVDLGIFTADYKIVSSKYDKYKQINRFVELVDQAFAETKQREISILDFGCGKSYLTFILYYYFKYKRGMKARIIGYDLKTDVVDHCNEIAKRYGYDGLEFHVADVTRDTLAQEHIDMVVTLHACDVATDYALFYAISRKVRYIFSVPCCQHEVMSTIGKGGELDVFMEHGIIKERMSALLTDAIRAGLLEDKGYDVDLIEFIDFEHSPKNLMIRAQYSGKIGNGHTKEAKELRDRYGFSQKLLELSVNADG